LLMELTCWRKETLLGPCAFSWVVSWPEVVALRAAVAGADEVVDKLV